MTELSSARGDWLTFVKRNVNYCPNAFQHLAQRRQTSN